MIIGITGRIAAGKGFIVDFLKENGFEFKKISESLYEEADKRGIPYERKLLQDLGNQLRKEEGGGALAKRLVKKLDPSKNYIVDSIRNPQEVLELKKARNFFLISIDAPQKIRFERVLRRNKEIDPKTWEEFVEIDNRDFCEKDSNGKPVELGQQVGKCMEIADFKLMNDSNFVVFEEKFIEVFGKMRRQVVPA